MNGRIWILQQAVVSGDEIAIACSWWDTRAEACPLRGEQGCHATIEPIDVCSPCGGDADEDHFGDAVRVSLGVSEPKGRAPRTAKQQPSVNIQVLSKLLQVRQEMCRRIDRQIWTQVTGVRHTPATTSLVEQHDPVGFRIEVATYSCRTTRAGATVEDDSGFAMRVAADLPIDKMSIANIQHPLVVRFDCWVEHCHINSLTYG